MISFKQFLAEADDPIWDEQIVDRLKYVAQTGIIISLMGVIEKAFPHLSFRETRDPCCAALLHLRNIGKLNIRFGGKPWSNFDPDDFTFAQRQAFNRMVMLGKKYL